MNGSQQINKDLYAGVNQVTLVPAGATTSKRGRGAGIYCEHCDLTFKDSIDYSDHLISRQHLNNAGIELVTKRATVEDVKKRLEFLRKKYRNEKEEYDIYKRIDNRREQKPKRKKQKTDAENEQKGEDEGEMAKIMGFSKFT